MHITSCLCDTFHLKIDLEAIFWQTSTQPFGCMKAYIFQYYNMCMILDSTTKRVLHLIRFYLFQFFFYAIYLCCSSSPRCSVRATFFYTLNETYVNWNEQVYEACVRNSKMIDVEMLRKLLMWKILIGFGGYDALSIRNRKLMMAESAKSRLFFDVQLLVCFFLYLFL